MLPVRPYNVRSSMPTPLSAISIRTTPCLSRALSLTKPPFSFLPMPCLIAFSMIGCTVRAGSRKSVVSMSYITASLSPNRICSNETYRLTCCSSIANGTGSVRATASVLSRMYAENRPSASLALSTSVSHMAWMVASTLQTKCGLI